MREDQHCLLAPIPCLEDAQYEARITTDQSGERRIRFYTLFPDGNAKAGQHIATILLPEWFWQKRIPKHFKDLIKDELGLAEDDAGASWRSIKQSIYAAEEDIPYEAPEELENPEDRPEEFDQETLDKAMTILEDPGQCPLRYLVETAQALHIGDQHLIAIQACSGVTAWCKTRPVHVGAIGSTGKGKTDAMMATLKLFPEGSYHVFTSTSAKAFFYAQRAGYDFKNKIIVIDEAHSSQDAVPIFRALTDTSPITPHHASVQDQEFIDLKVDGPLAVWTTSVTPIQDDQLKDRFLYDNPDETPQADGKVIEHIWKTFAQARELELNPEAETRYKVARCMLDVIRQTASQYRVLVPWARIMEPPLGGGSRRLATQYIILIKAIAAIHALQSPRLEPRDGDGYIFATKQHLEEARSVFTPIEEYSKTKQNEASVQLLRAIPGDFQDAADRKQLASACGKSTSWVKKYAEPLLDDGLINSEISDGRTVYWKQGKTSLHQLARSLKWSRFTERGLQNFLKGLHYEYKQDTRKKICSLLYPQIISINHDPLIVQPPPTEAPETPKQAKEGQPACMQPETGSAGNSTGNDKERISEISGIVDEFLARIENQGYNKHRDAVKWLTMRGLSQTQAEGVIASLKDKGAIYESQPGRWSAS